MFHQERVINILLVKVQLFLCCLLVNSSPARVGPLAGTNLLPDDFSCTPEMPRQSDIYSVPPNSNLIKVDLIHIFCGQIYSSGSTNSSSRAKVGGFHARPGDEDPKSATTANSLLQRSPPDQYGYAVYKYPYVYDYRREMFLAKNTGSISSIWPTVLSMEEITEIITRLVYLCRPSRKLNLCVTNFILLPGQSIGETFDVVIIITSNGSVARSAYPAARGTCSNKSSYYFHKCNFNYISSYL